MLSGKGKYASATENRRLVWDEIVWPLVLENGDVAFSLAQFQARRDVLCKARGLSVGVPSRGLASLIQRGVVAKEGGGSYSIHYRLVPYMRLGAACDYATAIHEAKR